MLAPDPPTAPPAGLRLASARGRWVLLATVLGSGLAGIDATIVAIALPAIGRDLGAGFAGLQWTVTGYTLSLASLILLGGATGDRIGRRRAFVVGVVWFTVASVLCALAPGVGFLVAARVLQGVGGALLTPASLAIIEASFAPEDRAPAVGAWAGLSGTATAVAPFVGGWLLAVASWRWVFLVNIPVAVVVVAVALRHVPETRDEEAGARADWRGSVTTVVGLAGLTYALIASGRPGAGPQVVAAGTIGVLALVALPLVERRLTAPLLPPDLFRSAGFSAANGVTFLVYAAIGGFFFLVVLQLQLVTGYSPLAAGTALIPVTVLTLLLSARSGRLAQHIGPRLQMTLGPLLCAGGVVLCLRWGYDAAYVRDVLPAVCLFGLGLATMVAPLTATALAAAPAAHAGVASGVNNAVARAGSLLAVAALPVLAGITGDAYQDPALFLEGFRHAMVACAVLFTLGGLLAAATIRRPLETDAHDRGAEAVGRLKPGPAGRS